VIEAAVASFLSADASERLEAVFAHRMDRLGRQIDGMDEDLAILGETLSLFIRFWLTVTPPLPDSAQASARAKGMERFEASCKRSAGNWRRAIGSSETCRATSTRAVARSPIWNNGAHNVGGEILDTAVLLYLHATTTLKSLLSEPDFWLF
jgi:hypothetical protein